MRTRITKASIRVVFILALVCGLAPAVAASAESDKLELLRQTSEAFSSVAAEAVPAVVFIRVERTIETGAMTGPGVPFGFNDPFGFFGDEFYDRFFRGRQLAQPREYRQSGQGSGFIIGDDGYILTNNHVVGEADVITVKLNDGREFKAELVGADEKSDVAVIKIDGRNLPTLSLGDSDSLKVGEWVIAIGNPFGLAETLTSGIVSAKGRSTVGINDYEDFIQTDAAINPGNSGGPLINIKGEAIGGGNMGIGFAIPINMAKAIKDQLVKTGKVTRGQLGVSIGELTQELADYFEIDSTKGALVNEILEGSPAEKAGLQVGDVILKIDGREVSGIGDLRNTIAMAAPGSKVELLVQRDGKQRTVTVRIGELSETQALADTSELDRKLGLTVENMTEEARRYYGLSSDDGVLISSVSPNSTAHRNGIRPGMVILSVNRKAVDSVEQFNSALRESAESKKVLLLVRAQRYTQFVVLPLE
ncbi:MAG: DegQ family serine endoprotease [Planctomycetota bacterium]|jgi:serine protease Do